MFYACDVMVSSFVSFALCCVPSRTCLYFVLVLLISLCVSVFTAFERVFCPPSSACLFSQGKLMCHLRASNPQEYAACNFVLGRCVLLVLLMTRIFGFHD
jgi:hypothetical protein